MDDGDRAEVENAAHMAAWKKNRGRRFEGQSMTDCRDCGRRIPAARRAALADSGLPCERCAGCQAAQEKRVCG